MLQQSLYKRFLSFLYPVLIAKAATPKNPVLELYLYRNRYQLGTYDALYSDGDKYRPLLTAFNKIGSKLQKADSILVLGTGLGSAAQILYGKGYRPGYTFVEYDEKILQWALATLPVAVTDKADTILGDAAVCIQRIDKQYGMVVVDIFNSRIVPPFVTTADFLKQCRRCIKPGGYFVLNYIINNEDNWNDAKQQIQSVFPTCEVLQNSINRIFIATV